MKNANTSAQPTRQDRSLLRQTLWSLTAVHKVVCIVVIAVVTLAWLSLLKRVLAFGKTVDYSGLNVLGVQAIALLQQYNPFFWWAVVVLCTLIIAYFLKLFVQGSRQRVMTRTVSTTVVQRLAAGLSQSAISVLNWAWADRREPLRVSDLDRALTEMAHGRANRIDLARQHQALLDPAAKQENPPETL